MSVKERVIKESIKRIEKRIAEIDGIMGANPLSEICEGRIKAQAILKEHKGDYEKIGKLIGPLADREKYLFKLAKKQNTNTFKFIDEKVDLQCELGELHNEKYFLDLKRQQSGN